MTKSITVAIEDAKQVSKGLIHGDETLYPLLLQALYPEHIHQVQSYMALAHRVLSDPSPEQIIFLPEFMQERVSIMCHPLEQGDPSLGGTVDPHFCEDDRLRLYPPDHPELLAFVKFLEQFPEGSTQEFQTIYLKQQRQKLYEEGVRVVGLEEGADYLGLHTVILAHAQALPAYEGETTVIVCDDAAQTVSPALTRGTDFAEVSADGKIAGLRFCTLPVQAIRLLFNDPELFYERYILNISPPYHPGNYLGTKAIRQYLLEGILPKTNTIFDRHQLEAMKAGWEAFKETLLGDVKWNTYVKRCHPGESGDPSLKGKEMGSHFLGDDKPAALYGTIDLIWNDGLYLLTKNTPPSRNALLNGIAPELPLLAVLYNQPIDHLGYIHIKGHGQDAIQITRYTNPQELMDANLEKLATASHNSGPQEEPA